MQLAADQRSCKLKRNSDHYYQCQSQIHFTGRRKCYFLIYNANQRNNWLYVEEIDRDDAHMARLVPVLNR